MKKIITTVAAICLSFSAIAMDSTEWQKHRLRDKLFIADLKMCSDRQQAQSDYEACRVTPLGAIKRFYAEGSGALKVKAHKEAFKNYYVALQLQAKALDVITGEYTRDFNSRQSQASRATDEAWVKFEIEMEF